MRVLIGIDPHKASVALAVVDQATGELVERGSFPQDRAGLRAPSTLGLPWAIFASSRVDLSTNYLGGRWPSLLAAFTESYGHNRYPSVIAALHLKSL